MNPAADASWHPADLKASLRLPVICLLASVVLHVTLLLAMPGWWRSAPPEVPPVLDVVLIPAETPKAVALPPPPPEKPHQSRAQPSPRPMPAAPPAQARSEIAVAPSTAEPVLPAVVETPRAPVVAPPAPPAVRSEPVTTPPVFNAAYLRNPPPRYPLAARRNGEEGTVILRVLVTADGAAARVELDRTSGSTSLDGAALEAVRGWRFVPARRGSQNVEDWVRVPVVFRIES